MSESTQDPSPREAPRAGSGTSPADDDHEHDGPEGAGADDDAEDLVPEDLRPGDDNPLAEPLDPDDEATKSREELEMYATQESLGNDDGASTAPDQAGDGN